MKYLPLIWAGLWRKKTRTILTFLSVVVAFILFGILAGVTGALDQMLGTSRMDRMFADPKFGDPLPVTYLAQIAAVPGVKLVAPRMRMVGYYKDPKNSLGVITTDTRFFAVRPEIQIKQADIQAWEKDRQGAVVDANWARKYGWKVGDKIPLISPIPTKDGSNVWTFDIIAIVTDATTTDSAWFLANYRYLDDRRAAGNGKANRFLIFIDDPQKGAQIAQTIDKMFVNSPAPTRSGSERTDIEVGITLAGRHKLFHPCGDRRGAVHAAVSHRQHHDAVGARAHSRIRGDEDSGLLGRRGAESGAGGSGVAVPSGRHYRPGAGQDHPAPRPVP